LLLSGRADGGRVFILGREPILDVALATNQQLALTLYALPGERYALERSGALGGAALWSFDQWVDATDLRTDLPLRPLAHGLEFFRARAGQAGVPLSIRLENGEVVIEWPLDCAGCVLEETGQTGAGASWTTCPVQPQATEARYRVRLPPTGTQRFYRLAMPGP
jgi:hypothetical protein